MPQPGQQRERPGTTSAARWVEEVGRRAVPVPGDVSEARQCRRTVTPGAERQHVTVGYRVVERASPPRPR